MAGDYNYNYQSISVQTLRFSDSGKAVLVLDLDRTGQDEDELWIPLSLIENVEDIDIDSFSMVDLNVADWFLEQEGWND